MTDPAADLKDIPPELIEGLDTHVLEPGEVAIVWRPNGDFDMLCGVRQNAQRFVPPHVIEATAVYLWIKNNPDLVENLVIDLQGSRPGSIKNQKDGVMLQ